MASLLYSEEPESTLDWSSGQGAQNRKAAFEALASLPGIGNLLGYTARPSSLADRPFEDRHEALKQDYLGDPKWVAQRRRYDKLIGMGEEAVGRAIVRNTPKQLELQAIQQRYPGMTEGIPLESLSKVWNAVVNDEANVARQTDAKKWDPRDHPDKGLPYAPKSLERQLLDEQATHSIGYAPRGTDPVRPGITNTYEVSPQAKALGNVIAALNDPRNAWLGVGAIRGMRLLSPIPKGPEMGGFRETTANMRRAFGTPRENLRAGEVPSAEHNLRADYLGELAATNTMAKDLLSNPKAKTLLNNTIEVPDNYSELFQQVPNLEATILNLNRLNHYTKIAPHTTYGKEGPPPEYLVKKFGYK